MSVCGCAYEMRNEMKLMREENKAWRTSARRGGDKSAGERQSWEQRNFPLCYSKSNIEKLKIRVFSNGYILGLFES